MAILTQAQVTKTKVVSNHYSDSVVMSGHHQDTASSIVINQDPSFLSEFGAILIFQTCTGMVIKDTSI